MPGTKCLRHANQNPLFWNDSENTMKSRKLKDSNGRLSYKGKVQWRRGWQRHSQNPFHLVQSWSALASLKLVFDHIRNMKQVSKIILTLGRSHLYFSQNIWGKESFKLTLLASIKQTKICSTGKMLWNWDAEKRSRC